MNRKKFTMSRSKTKMFLAFVLVSIFIVSVGLSAITSTFGSSSDGNVVSSGTEIPSSSNSSSVAIGIVSPLAISSLNYFSPVECYYFVSMLYLPFAAYQFPPQPYLECELGQSVTHNATYESWNLTLKKDLKWDNGSPLNSSDLWLTLWFANDTCAITNVSSITIINSTTVNVILSSPQPNFVDQWVTATNSYIIPYQTFYPLVGSNYSQPLSRSFESFSNEQNIVSDAPYIITNYTAGTNPIIFTANKYYYEGAPQMGEITVRLFSSASSMSAGLRSGEIDAMWDMGPYNTVVSPLFTGIANTKVYNLLPAGYMSAAFNMRQWPYNTTQFRQALAYLTDRVTISNIVDEDNAPMACYSGMTPSIENATGINPSSINNYTYNISKATALLAEIGIDKDNTSGSANYGLFVYNNSSLPDYGTPVTINITTTQNGYGDVSTSVELEDQWTAAGFKVSVTSISSSSYIPLVSCSATGWDVGVSLDYSGFPPLDSADIDAIFESDNSTFTANGGYSAQYNASFGAENYNFTLLSKLYNESESYPLYTAQSNQYVQEAADIIAYTVPIIPLFIEANTVAASNSYYWGNSTNYTGLYNHQALVQPELWYGTLWALHPIVSTNSDSPSGFGLYDYIIIGVVIAVVVIVGAVGVTTSRKHKKEKASDKEEDEAENKNSH